MRSAIIALLLILPGLALASPVHREPTCPLPSLAVGAADVVVLPTDAGWNSVWSRITPATRQILLTPGNYQAWGHLDAGPIWPDGLVLRYYDPATEGLHPVDRRAPATEAVIHGVLFWGGTHGWVVHGLTIRAPSAAVGNGMVHVLDGDRVIVDANLIEDSPQSYGIRIRDSIGVCVQRNVIRNATNPANDNTGINVKPNTRPVVGLRIVDNEIADWIDSVQVTNQLALGVQARITGNDLYTTTARHVMDPADGLVYGCTENAIDIKAPPFGTGYLIAKNRMRGWRETPLTPALCGAGFSSGSAGDAIIVHIDATDVAITGNEISDSVAALRASNRVGGRRITFHRNTLRDIPGDGAATRFYGGAALVLEDDASINGNVLDGVPLLCPRHGFPYATWPPAGYSPAAPRVSRNVTSGMVDGGACSAAAIVEETPR